MRHTYQSRKKFTALLMSAFLVALFLTACGNPAAASSAGTVSSSENQTANDAAENDASGTANTGEETLDEDAAEDTKDIKSSGEEVKSASRDVFAMDTYMTITCYGDQCEEALDAAEAEIHRLDDLLSVGNADSEISQINGTGSGELSEDTRIMVSESLDLYKETKGAFDITVYPLMVLWGFTDEQYKVPEPQELQTVLDTAGSDKLSFDESENVLTLSTGQGIDLGGIAKGYTSDRLMEIFADYDLVSGMVSLGGNVELYGVKPDGSLWKCGIQDPHQEETGASLLGILEISDAAVITSGAYERYFIDDDGNRYHHIIDPKTGYPANNGLISATIVSTNGMLADGLSTSCYVLGLDDAIEYWKTSGENFDMILMTDEDEVYITPGLESCFSTDYPLHVIS